MLELEALDSAGSLISIALAARHLPHTCLKVMKNHLRECALRSGCHLLPANSAHPDNEEKAGNTTQPHQAVCSNASTCFTNDLWSVLKVADILFTPGCWPVIGPLGCQCHASPLSDIIFLFLLQKISFRQRLNYYVKASDWKQWFKSSRDNKTFQNLLN